MGDVTLVLKNTSTGGGGTGDDEDGWDGMSGSGDGYGEFTNSQSWKTTARSTRKGSVYPGKDSQTNGESDMVIYIIVACIAFAVAIISISALVICCRRRAKARRNREKSNLSNQGSEIKILANNRETRVFGSITGRDHMDLQRIEHERELSRFMAPPTTAAPSPPKVRAAPEAEKLLKSHSNPSDRLHPESKSLLSSSTAEINHYEEIVYVTDGTKINDSENSDLNKGSNTLTGNQKNKNTKDADSPHTTKSDTKHKVVAKPRKIPRNIKPTLDASLERSLRPESSV